MREFLRGFLMQDGMPPPLSDLSPLTTPPRKPSIEVPKIEPQIVIQEKYIYVHVHASEETDGIDFQAELTRLQEEAAELREKVISQEALLSQVNRQLAKEIEVQELLRSKSEVLTEELRSVKTELHIAKESLRESRDSIAKLKPTESSAVQVVQVVKEEMRQMTPERKPSQPSQQNTSITKPRPSMLETMVAKNFNPLPLQHKKASLSPEPVLRKKQI